MKNNKKIFGKTAKVGTYTVIMSLILLAVIVAVNILVLNLPSTMTKIDVTKQQMYTLSGTTLEAVPKIEDKINIYLLCSGGEDASGGDGLPYLSKTLDRYADLNSKIKVEIIDTVDDPTFVTKYTEEALSNYSIIVESDKRFKIISPDSLYYYSIEGYDGKLSANDYSYLQYYAQMSGQAAPEGTLFYDGETAVTSALDYVTTSDIPAVYIVNDFGEDTALSATLIDRIETENISVSEISLMTDAIPEDAEAIILNAPTNDISADMSKKLSEYLDNGGKLFLTTIATVTDYTNLMGVLEKYGLSMESGCITEETSGYYYAYPYYLLPTPSSESAITAPYTSEARLLTNIAHPITIGESLPENITVTPLFSTSENAKLLDLESGEAIEDKGQYNVAVAATDSSNGSAVIWLSSPAFNDQFNEITVDGNYTYFIAMLESMAQRERIVENIPPTSLVSDYLIVPEASANVWSIILTAIIPLAFLLCGIGCWYIRRRR